MHGRNRLLLAKTQTLAFQQISHYQPDARLGANVNAIVTVWLWKHAQTGRSKLHAQHSITCMHSVCAEITSNRLGPVGLLTRNHRRHRLASVSFHRWRTRSALSDVCWVYPYHQLPHQVQLAANLLVDCLPGSMGGWMSELPQWWVSAAGLHHHHHHHHRLTLVSQTAADQCRVTTDKSAQPQTETLSRTNSLQGATSEAQADTLHTHINPFSLHTPR